MKQYAIEIKWALYFTAMMLFWMILEKMSGLHSTYIHLHPIYTNLVAIPAITMYVLALLDKRKNFYNGVMSYGQGFLSGLILTLFVTLLSPLTQLITSLLITPEYFPNAIQHAVTSGNLSQPEAEAYFNLKNYLIQVVIGTPVMGIVTTLIVALFTQRKPK